MPVPTSPIDPVFVARPKRWPWFALILVVGVAAIAVLSALHEREQHARNAQMQATIFAGELRDSVRELTAFGDAVPEASLTRALRPVIASTADTALARIDRLDAFLDGDKRTTQLRLQVLQIQRVAASVQGPIAFGDRLKSAANEMARTADAIARDEHDRADLFAHETMIGGALAILLGLGVVAAVLQRSQRLLVSAGRRQATQLQDLADHDPLTGLANRRRLEDDLDRLSEHASSAAPVQVMICDLDGFKRLNDTLGHDAGDELLVRFAAHLRQAAGDRGSVYRLGGDEFCLLSDPGQDVARPVARVLARNSEGAVRGSAGTALWPSEAPTARAAMRLADERMYAVKAARRDDADADAVDAA
jgi:diguanylate cyclase (GGDEF)-like protein